MQFIDENEHEIDLAEFVRFWSMKYDELNNDHDVEEVYNYFINYPSLDREKLLWLGAWKWGMVRRNPSCNNESCLTDKYIFKQGWVNGKKKEHKLYNQLDIELLNKNRYALCNEDRNTQNRLCEMLLRRKDLSIVNLVFIFHIVCPSVYPIYDQFVPQLFRLHIWWCIKRIFKKSKSFWNIPQIQSHIRVHRRL